MKGREATQKQEMYRTIELLHLLQHSAIKRVLVIGLRRRGVGRRRIRHNAHVEKIYI